MDNGYILPEKNLKKPESRAILISYFKKVFLVCSINLICDQIVTYLKNFDTGGEEGYYCCPYYSSEYL